MQGLKEQIRLDITALSYLEKLDEEMIWESYKQAVPMALAEVDAECYQPSTMQLLNRFNGRIILEIRKKKQTSVNREEFEELR